MADLKISQLTGATTPLAGTEVLPIVQSSSTKKVAVSDLTAGRAVSAASLTTTGTIQGAIVNAISGTGDQLLINAKTNDGTAANNAGIGLRANSSATAGSRFAQLWFDADGGNLSGGDYFLMTKNGNDGTIDLIQYSNSAMRFAANYIGRAAIDLTIGTTGNITFNTGNLVQGTAGKGIDFSVNTHAAGMTSELLNYYEEGTWTPNSNFGWTDSGTVTRTGTYTRIGRQVFVTIKIAASGGGSVAMNQANISNLPYTAANPAIGGWGVVSNYGATTQTQNVLVDGAVMYFTGSWPAVANYTYTATVTYTV